MDTSSPPPTKPARSAAIASRPSVAVTAVVQALVLVTVSAGTGIAVNYTRLMTGEIEAEAERRPGVKLRQRWIELSEMIDAFDAGDAIFVDVRPSAAFEAGHIPGAVNLPHKKADEAFAPVSQWFREDVPVVLYGKAGDVGDVIEAQTLLVEAGCRHRLLFRHGFEAWRSAGRPVATGLEPIWGPER